MNRSLIGQVHKKVPKDFLQVFIFDILSKVFMIVITIILIRIMSPSQYADIVKFTALSSFIYGVFGEGISLSFIRYSTEQYSRTGKSTVGLHAVSSLLIFILSFLVITLVPVLTGIYNTTAIVVIYASFYGFILSLINMNQAFFQSREMYVKSGITNNLRNVFILISLLYLMIIFKEVKATQVFLVYVICGSIAFVFGIIRIYKGTLLKEILSNRSILKLMLQDSFGIVIYLVILNVINQIDIVMISNMMTEKDVAMYGIAFKYYSLLLTLLPSIKAVLRVRTSKKEYIDDIEQRKKFTLIWLKRTWKFVIPFSVFVILASDIFMPIMNGEQYDEAINTFKILCVGVGISYMFASNTSIMMAAKKYKTLCLLAITSLGVNVLVNWMLIPVWGINGAAVATILTHMIINVSATFFIFLDKGESVK
ncbi:polysaccharide biosynthesis C-terminal domain-containing protein [Paenibacillus wynnii]|uniref:Uncharacterized protein n=1 Tax=Paenibacillus wynnii TaxID=268407 RepID=A0A098M8F0_9BACL|nr:polysaccharide biosynthesis C-terminal domain-containing protein [Paenibacillus wynnii]KGE18323.1 hypothetical protein PWYN_27810 [Paenibacillus wynnii]